MAAAPNVMMNCPFCGSWPIWLRKDSPRSAEGEAPMRALGCGFSGCSIKPQTKWRDTQEFHWADGTKKRQGYHVVDHDAEAIAEWGTRTE